MAVKSKKDVEIKTNEVTVIASGFTYLSVSINCSEKRDEYIYMRRCIYFITDALAAVFTID